MRGNDVRRDGLFSYVRPESRIPSNHPFRLTRGVADEALKALDTQFAALYSEDGWPSIPPVHQPAARPAAASVLHDPFGAAVDGATQL
jgi:hypothetical protein